MNQDVENLAARGAGDFCRALEHRFIGPNMFSTTPSR